MELGSGLLGQRQRREDAAEEQIDQRERPEEAQCDADLDGPNHAEPSPGTSEGQTSAFRSSQKPSSEMNATPPRIDFVFLGSCPSSTQKGMTQQPNQAVSESFT